MAAERFFAKIGNDVLKASENIVDVFEESLSALWGDGGAKAGPARAPHDTATSHTTDGLARDEGATEFEMADNDIEEELRHNPLQGIANDVLGNIMTGQIQPDTPWEHAQAFCAAITWNEPFIMGLVAFQVLMFIICLYVTRKDQSLTLRLVVMVLIGLIVRMSERINGMAAQHWESFASQNYFDARGIFMSIMVCAPLLVDSLIMLFMFLREASQLLVVVKTRELKERKAKKVDQGSKKRTKKEQ